MKTFHANKSILNRGCLVLRNLSITPAFVRVLARTPGCVQMLLHSRRACPRDALVQRSARTVAILMQRSTAEKDGAGGGRVRPGAASLAVGGDFGFRPVVAAAAPRRHHLGGVQTLSGPSHRLE